MQIDTTRTGAPRRRERFLLAVAAAASTAVLAFGAAGPVAAAVPSVLFVGGGGIAVDDGAGGAVIEGPALVQDKHLREVLDATLRATVAPADGSLPAIGECEPAAATVEVDGVRDTDLALASDGTVCHVQHPVFTSFVRIEFTGLHEVTRAKRPQLRGVTGTLTITMAPSGFSTVHADSYVPTL